MAKVQLNMAKNTIMAPLSNVYAHPGIGIWKVRGRQNAFLECFNKADSKCCLTCQAWENCLYILKTNPVWII